MATSSHGEELSDTDTCSSSSSSYLFSKYGKKFPSRASHWRLEHLTELGIVYDEAPTDLGKFMTDLKMLKSVVRNGLTNMPKISSTLVQYTKDLWNFSYVFHKETGEETAEARDRIEKSIEEFEEKESDMEEQVKITGGNWKRYSTKLGNRMKI